MRHNINQSFVLFLIIVFCLVSSSSQITFSRTWVRGKYPGDELATDQADESNPVFLRAAKTGFTDFRDDQLYPRTVKSPMSLNSRLLKDILRTWKSPNSNRYKELNVPNFERDIGQYGQM